MVKGTMASVKHFIQMMMSIKHKVLMIRFLQQCILLHIWKLLIILITAIQELKDTFKVKQDEFMGCCENWSNSSSRCNTITLGQEISGWRAMLDKSLMNDRRK